MLQMKIEVANLGDDRDISVMSQWLSKFRICF